MGDKDVAYEANLYSSKGPVVLIEDVCVFARDIEQVYFDSEKKEVLIKFKNWTWGMEVPVDLSTDVVEAIGCLLQEYQKNPRSNILILNDRTISERVGILRLEKEKDMELRESEIAWEKGSNLSEYLEQNRSYFQKLVEKRKEQEQSLGQGFARRKIGI